MTPNQAYELLGQVPPESERLDTTDCHVTYLLVQLIERPNGSNIDSVSTIIDPSMPDTGGADEYLALKGVQRVALESMAVLDAALRVLAHVAVFAPMERTLWEQANHSKNKVAGAIRRLSMKAAARALEQSA